MHCAICDSDSDTVTPHTDCAVCQEAIQDCLDGYPKLEDNDDIERVIPDFDDDVPSAYILVAPDGGVTDMEYASAC